MTISTYNELQTSVKGWLHRASVTFDSVDYVPDLITMGEKYLFRHARTRDMETAFNVTIASGVAAIPADFVAMKYAYVDGTPTTQLQTKAASWIMLRYPNRSAEGKPKFFAVDSSNLIFGPYPDTDYTIKGTYYKRLTSITASANALFVANPDLYLYAALAECTAFIKDKEFITFWTDKRDKILLDINNEDTIARFSGGPLSMVVA